MRVFIAGSGLLGRALRDFLINSSYKKVNLLSIRNSSIDQINNILVNITNNDVFLDSMDPNLINNDVSEDHLRKIEIVRSNVLSNSSKFHYIFLSTASIVNV